MTSILGYWKIRGLAAPIRLILQYCGEGYEEIVYETGDAPDYSREEWFRVKPTLGLGPFVNLPYYIKGDLKIVESVAIINHLARKYNLDGESEEERVRGEVMLYRLKDTHQEFVGLCYNPAFEKLKPQFVEKLPGVLALYATYLGDNKYFAGNKITKVDFLVYEYLSQMSLFESGCLEAFPSLKGFTERIESIPVIKNYLESDRYYQHPVNNKVAAWK